MSTSDPDLEARLAALRPPPPREDLRDTVLASVNAELAKSARPSLLDRLLARRTTWAAAAAVLLALIATSMFADDAREQRIQALAARPDSTVRQPLRAWRERDALLAKLLHDGGRHD